MDFLPALCLLLNYWSCDVWDFCLSGETLEGLTWRSEPSSNEADWARGRAECHTLPHQRQTLLFWVKSKDIEASAKRGSGVSLCHILINMSSACPYMETLCFLMRCSYNEDVFIGVTTPTHFLTHTSTSCVQTHAHLPLHTISPNISEPAEVCTLAADFSDNLWGLRRNRKKKVFLKRTDVKKPPWHNISSVSRCKHTKRLLQRFFIHQQCDLIPFSLSLMLLHHTNSKL